MTQPPTADRESLQALLGKVHERLGEAGSVDAASRELLRQVMGDIERALGEQGTAAEANTPRLEALAVRFEADHPALAASLRRLADLLSNAGI
ncbi:MAG TPA: DUF4404 family protein [Steroidobacteraceae bacterium]|nr:DUF4404 family protein [Steroidobacteraceae bacterium]